MGYIFLVISLILTSLNIFSYVNVRYVPAYVPETFMDEYQIPNSEIIFTIRNDFYILYRFQKLSYDKRIEQYESGLGNKEPFSRIIAYFMEPYKVYKIAPDYCIVSYLEDEEIGLFNSEKTICNSPNIKYIDVLPDKRALAFLDFDENGKKFYYSYDIESLWHEFDRTTKKDYELQLQKEWNYHIKKGDILKSE